VTLTAQLVDGRQNAVDILAADQALARLAEFDSRRRRLLTFFFLVG
jgi:hypothetical protein